MFVLEFKIQAKKTPYQALDEAIRTTQFIRNKCVCHGMDHQAINKYAINKLCKQLAEEFFWAKELYLYGKTLGC